MVILIKQWFQPNHPISNGVSTRYATIFEPVNSHRSLSRYNIVQSLNIQYCAIGCDIHYRKQESNCL